MADYSVDPEAVRAMSTAVAHCTDTVPQTTLPEADACGSTTVAAAIADFARWRRVTWKQAEASLSGLASIAQAAAGEYAAADQGVTAQSSGGRRSWRTTASLALARADLHVNTFVSVASAGIENSIRDAADIHARQVFAEQARNALPLVENGQGDQYAWTGRDFSGRLNPGDLVSSYKPLPLTPLQQGLLNSLTRSEGP